MHRPKPLIQDLPMTPPALRPPPRLTNSAGRPRRVGVELEMGGLDLEAVAGCVAETFGLRSEPAGRYVRTLLGDEAGDWTVELDFAWLKRLGQEEHDPETLAGGIGRAAEEALAWAAEGLVPVEVVSPPLPLDRLAQVQTLVARLRAAGAKGSSDRVVNAFGMQLNPELPSLDAPTIRTGLQAFLCLYDWLFQRAEVDIARRVTGYAEPFARAFVLQVIAPDYEPDLATLIDDYLAANPTRNRALDLLPLFLHLDAERVRAVADDPRIKPRPTWHYRLPDCDIDEPGWGLHQAWNDWVEVERLAAEPERLAACCAAYRAYIDSPMDRLLGDWPAEVARRWVSSQA
jgi:hypothetical protein